MRDPKPTGPAVVHTEKNSMKMAVTAEGVETEEQLKYLRDEGCDLIHGT